QAFSAALTMSSTSAALETSAPWASASPPAASISPATALAEADGAPPGPKSLTTTLAPRAASPSAWQRPSPPPAPVTMATRPSNRMSIKSSRGLAGAARRRCIDRRWGHAERPMGDNQAHEPIPAPPAAAWGANGGGMKVMSPVLARQLQPLWRRRKARSAKSSSDCQPAAVSGERPARSLPGADAALDMTGRCEPRVLRRLHRHGGALAERAKEQQPFARRAGQFVQNAAGPDGFHEARIGRVQRAGDAAMALAFAFLAQVDQGDVASSQQRRRILRRHRPAALRHLLLMQSLAHVGGHRDIHHLRVGEFEAGHERLIFLRRTHLEARVVGAFLGYRADAVALVIVTREDQRFVGQLQQAVEDAFILRAGAAVLEIGAPGAADQQGVAGEHPIRQGEAIAVVGMAGRIDDVETDALDVQPLAIADPHRYDIDLALFAHHGDAFGVVVQVGVDRLDQLQIEFLDEFQVAVDAIEHGIDNQRLAAAAAGHQVGVRARRGVKELAEDHRPCSSLQILGSSQILSLAVWRCAGKA